MKARGTNLCLEVWKETTEVLVRVCDDANPLQQWTFGTYTDLYRAVESGENINMENAYIKDLATYLMSGNQTGCLQACTTFTDRGRIK